jgi:hypothetical protein
MPAAYEAIKLSLRRSHPDWPIEKVKSVAAATYIKRSKNRSKAARALHHG